MKSENALINVLYSVCSNSIGLLCNLKRDLLPTSDFVISCTGHSGSIGSLSYADLLVTFQYTI